MGISTAGRTFAPEPLTRDEAEALLRARSSRAPTVVRNRALIAVLYRAGLRVSEALALKPADVDLAGGTIRVLKAKGDRPRKCRARTVAIDAGACAIVERWLEQRHLLGLERSRFLFCTLGGGPLSANYVRQALRRLAGRAGVEKRVHPHGLRHTHAMELAREGVPVPVISAQLGHRSVATTAIYLSHVAATEVIDAIHSRPEWARGVCETGLPLATHKCEALMFASL